MFAGGRWLAGLGVGGGGWAEAERLKINKVERVGEVSTDLDRLQSLDCISRRSTKIVGAGGRAGKLRIEALRTKA